MHVTATKHEKKNRPYLSDADCIHHNFKKNSYIVDKIRYLNINAFELIFIDYREVSDRSNINKLKEQAETDIHAINSWTGC